MGKRNGYDSEKDVTVKTRKALELLWQKALTRARSWGRKTKGLRNPFFRTNIMYSDSTGNEIVVISFTDKPEQKAVIHHFVRAERSALGAETMDLLEKAGMPVES